ncbi:MAG: hypothetical protein ACRD2Q_07655 [Terriglobales bacterium]
MSGKLIAFVLAAALVAFAQGRSGGHAGQQGPPTGAGQSAAPGKPADAGRPADPGKPADAPNTGSSQGQPQTKQALKESQINSGAFRMLQDKTGKSSEELQQMYAASGAKNFGQFTSAVMVSQNLGLDTNAVLEGIKTKTLGQTLKDMGVSDETASAEIAKAKKEIKAANKKKSS